MVSNPLHALLLIAAAVQGVATYSLALMPSISIAAVPAGQGRHLFSPNFTLGAGPRSGPCILAANTVYGVCRSSLLLHLGSACKQRDF